MTVSERAARERAHDRHLLARGAESAWGWTTPAGRLRAARRAALIAAAGGLGPGKVVLEVGCGTGLFTEMFARSGAEIVAVDISDELIAVARTKPLPAGKVTFRCDEFETLDLDRHVDAIVGSSVLHHLDLDRALARMAALLSPGGTIAFAEPNLLNPQVFLERRFRSWFPYVSPDETAFVRWTLPRALARAGFADASVTPFDWLHPATPVALIPGVRLVGQLVEHVPGLREFAGSLLVTARRG